MTLPGKTLVRVINNLLLGELWSAKGEQMNQLKLFNYAYRMLFFSSYCLNVKNVKTQTKKSCFAISKTKRRFAHIMNERKCSE